MGNSEEASTKSGLLLHSIKRLLEQLEISRVAQFFPSGVDPFLFERVRPGTITFVEDATKEVES